MNKRPKTPLSSLNKYQMEQSLEFSYGKDGVKMDEKTRQGILKALNHYADKLYTNLG